jgi:hypothetical protein
VIHSLNHRLNHPSKRGVSMKFLDIAANEFRPRTTAAYPLHFVCRFAGAGQPGQLP